MKIPCKVSEAVEAFSTYHNHALLMLVTFDEGLQTELGQLCGGDALTYQPLYEMVQVTVCCFLSTCACVFARVCLHVLLSISFTFSIIEFKWEYSGHYELDGASEKCP